MRLVSSLLWPVLAINTRITDRRIRAAAITHAAEQARIASLAHGEYFRDTLADDCDPDCWD